MNDIFRQNKRQWHNDYRTIISRHKGAGQKPVPSSVVLHIEEEVSVTPAAVPTGSQYRVELEGDAKPEGRASVA